MSLLLLASFVAATNWYFQHFHLFQLTCSVGLTEKDQIVLYSSKKNFQSNNETRIFSMVTCSLNFKAFLSIHCSSQINVFNVIFTCILLLLLIIFTLQSTCKVIHQNWFSISSLIIRQLDSEYWTVETELGKDWFTIKEQLRVEIDSERNQFLEKLKFCFDETFDSVSHSISFQNWPFYWITKAWEVHLTKSQLNLGVEIDLKLIQNFCFKSFSFQQNRL